MKPYLFFLVFIMVFSAGCAGKPFQPIPPKFKQWKKEGISIERVKAALIKCGYDNPYNGFDTQKKVALNEIVRADVCMEQRGFRYLLSDRKTVCDGRLASSLPACQ